MTTLLAIDTSGDDCSVVVQRGSQVVAERSERSGGSARQQSERVLGWIADAMAEATLSADQVDAIAVAIGPGAFTGVRLGLAVAQGLGLAWQRPLLPVSSLAALACTVPAQPLPILTLLDARMGEVYAGWYRRQSDGGVLNLLPEQVCAPEAVSRPAGVGDYLVLGSGLVAYREVLTRHLGEPAAVGPALAPNARAVAALALQAWPEGAQAPERVEPAYLRNKVALTTAERASKHHANHAR